MERIVTHPDAAQPSAPLDLEAAAQAFAKSVAATPQYSAYADVQKALAGDPEAQELLRRYAELKRRFDHGGVFVLHGAEESAEFERVEEALSENALIICLQDTQVKLFRLFADLNQVVSDEVGMDFAKAAAPGGGCCG